MRLNQVTIPSQNVTRSILFYQKLGLELIVKELPQYARFYCPEGGATFSIHLVDVLPVGEVPWIYFESENLDSLCAELSANGILFESMPQDQPWLWREARLRDPDNNVLILYHAGVNRVNPPWKIK